MRLLAPFGGLLVIAGVVLSGCGATDPSPAGSGATGEELNGQLRIFAATSLASAFDEIAARFEEQHPVLDVLPISYDGSRTLATQIIEGAPADVFASADEATMDAVVDAGAAADPVSFAANTLVIAVGAGNPAGIETLADLAAPDLTVVLCAPEVPCGSASAALLEIAEVDVTPASLEQNVTAVRTKIASGDADAGLVYATDARRDDALEVIVPEGADEVVNTYPIAVVTGSAQPAAAAAFVAFVRSAEGQAVLARLGFGLP